MNRLKNENLSTVERATTASLIYSSLSAHAGRWGGELPGTWFVRALGGLGRPAAGVRQTLYRMERNGEIESRKQGRAKLYRLSPFGAAAVEAGGHMIFGDEESEWDGSWTLVHYQFPAAQRALRDRIRRLLELEGFAPLDRGVYLHPRDRSPQILGVLAEFQEAGEVMVFHVYRVGGESDRELVARLWDLSELGRSYRLFVRRFQPLTRRSPNSWEPREAFVTRFALVLEYLWIAWRDPELAQPLLPRGWQGPLARRIARELYETLLPPASAHAETFLDLP